MKRNDKKQVAFSCIAPDAKSVYLVGTFNDWKPDATPLKASKSGKWSVKLGLEPGRYEFKFIVDGLWCCEPGSEDEYKEDGEDCCPNEMGTVNRVLKVV